MFALDWSETIVGSLQNVWFGVVDFLPRLIIAVIVFVVGWMIGTIVERAVDHVINSVKLDVLLEKVGVMQMVKRAGYKFSSGKFFGALVRWFFVIVALIASLEIVGLSEVNKLLSDVALVYIPDVIVASLVLLIGSVVADVVDRLVKGAALAAEIKAAVTLGRVARVAVIVISVLIGLSQLGVAASLINTIFIGFVAMIALAGGLAFGLGGKEVAGKMLDRLYAALKTRPDISDKKSSKK